MARNILEQALITAGDAGTNASVNRVRYLGEETPPSCINSCSSEAGSELQITVSNSARSGTELVRAIKQAVLTSDRLNWLRYLSHDTP